MTKLQWVFWAVVLFVGAMALLRLPPWLERLDTAMHILAFYTLGCAALVAFPYSALASIAAALMLAGLAIETAQLLPIFGHAAQWSDLIADMAGIAAALIPAALTRVRRRQRRLASRD